MNLLHSATILLLVSSVFCAVKDLHDHFDDPKGQGPRSVQSNISQDLEKIPPEFHQENTVTNDLIHEEEEDDDYLDFDKIFGEDEDYTDIIDPTPDIKNVETERGNIFELFHGKTRIQRLNIINANFAFNLYRAIQNTVNTTENILLAPVGISTALATISLGTKEQTLKQILSTLGFKDFINASTKYDIFTIHNVFRKLTHRLFRRNYGYTLRSVNDIYITKDFSVHEKFKESLKQYYFAEAQMVDFEDPSFLTKANQRIQKLTKGLVKEAIPNVDSSLLMLLVNCIYFKGTWENKFPVEFTQNMNFRLNEKELVKVPMMKTKGNFLVAADHELDCGVLQLPYVGNISMIIVLPNKLSGMKLLEKQLTPRVVDRWQKIMTNRTREVYLPRFRLEKKNNLIDVLRSMGAKDLFSDGDFSGISDEKINIGKFQHQVTIMVNEEGTEAAAVTTVGFMPLSTQARFVVDRPFIFLVYEHHTNCLTFMGRVSNPTQS
ncbi:heparin cofactor 2 [Bombina bombina]|uniref:heparin cofactor 2 n=1 Tax=Bombina bombina TaxID=8345 RepID=UPI00235AF21B|nr:heparin cofactor 2 [Bombina bombina]